MTTMKRKRRRPAKRIMPDPIPDTPENIMRAVVNTPPQRRVALPDRGRPRRLTSALSLTYIIPLN